MAGSAKRTHCKNGHAFSADNVQSSGADRRCLTCRKAYMLRWGRDATVSAEQAREIVSGAYAGRTKASLHGRYGRTYVGGRVIQLTKLNAFLASQGAIGRKLNKLFQKNARAATIAGRIRTVAAPAILRNDGADAFAAIQAATREILEPMRGSIQSDLWLAVAEGRLKLRDIPAAVRGAITNYRRAERHSVMSRWGNKSLDAAIGDDGFSLLDTIADTGSWSPVAVNTGRHISTRNWS